MLNYPGIPQAPIVMLKYRCSDPQALKEFLQRALPIYEEPGGICVRLFEDIGNPGHFIELVFYSTEADYVKDDERVNNDASFKQLLSEWHELISDLEVVQAKPVDLI